MEAIIYMWTSPDGRSYVGQTKDPDTRMKHHKECVGASSPFHSAIKKHGWINFEYRILHSGNFSKKELDALESEEIKKRNTLVPNGYNILDGTTEQYYKIKRGRCRKIINPVTMESFSSISEAARRYNLHKENIQKVLSGKIKSTGGRVFVYLEDYVSGVNYQVEKTNGGSEKKAVRCINTGETWESISDCMKALNLTRAGVSNCCNKKASQTKGFMLEFV